MENKYCPANSSQVLIMKPHFHSEKGFLEFIEVKQGTTGKAIERKLFSQSFIKSRIKQMNMATKKKAVAKKKAPVKKISKTAAAKVAKAVKGETLKSKVDDLVLLGYKNAEIFEALNKAKISYSEKSVRWYASKARLAQKDAG